MNPLKLFTIKRTHSLPDGTFGVMDCEGVPFCLTIELPWKDNKTNISCIPTGEYTCKRVTSPKFGETFEVTGVPSRDHVLVHVANTVSDLLGCIGVGEQFEPIDGKNAVVMSKNAFWEFMKKCSGIDEFKLVIKDV